jgi:hypothetical protein
MAFLERRRVRLVFAELKGPVKDLLRRYGLYDHVGDDGFHSTVDEAVAAARGPSSGC